jgi:hypothetical protein
MQSDWLRVLDIADDYWDLTALPALCSDCSRISHEVAEDLASQSETLSLCIPVLSTASSENLPEPWMSCAEGDLQAACKGRPQRLRWSDEEDRKLGKLARTFKQDWSRVARYFRNKPPHALRERWSKRFRPKTVVGNWTEGEDGLIVKLLEIEGSNWVKIAKQLPGRLPETVKNRFIGTLRKQLPSQVLEQIALKDHHLARQMISLCDTPPGLDGALVQLNSASQAHANSSTAVKKDLAATKAEQLQALSRRQKSLEASISDFKAQILRLG